MTQNFSSNLPSQPAPAPPTARHRAPATSANLPLVPEDTADPALLDSFQHYRDAFHQPTLPGIVRCFATNPALLRGMMEIASGFLFTDSLLTRRQKEMIAVSVSQLNSCPYCADSHAAMLESLGGTPETLCALRSATFQAAEITPQESLLLHFAAKLTAASSSILRSDVEQLILAGWTEPQISEAVHVAALFAAFNRIANGFGLPSPFFTQQGESQ